MEKNNIHYKWTKILAAKRNPPITGRPRSISTEKTMNRAMTLEQFNNTDMPDGMYAVWTDQIFFPNEMQEAEDIIGNGYRFSGFIVPITRQNGFEGGYPSWVDDADPVMVNVVLLSEIPSKEDLVF